MEEVQFVEGITVLGRRGRETTDDEGKSELELLGTGPGSPKTRLIDARDAQSTSLSSVPVQFPRPRVQDKTVKLAG